MKVLQVNNVVDGSTGKLMNDIHAELCELGHKSIVCYGRGPIIKKPNYYRVCSEFYSHVWHFISRCTGYRYGGYFAATRKIIRIIHKEKPDIVHIQCINANFVNIYMLLEYLAKKQINTVLTLHAEFMYTGNCPHAEECNKWKSGCGNCEKLWYAAESYFWDNTHKSWDKFRKIYRKFERDKLIYVAVSDWVLSRAKESPLLNCHSGVTILNGIENENIFIHRKNSLILSKYYKDNKPYILYVTAFFDTSEEGNKGGKYIVDLAERLATNGINVVVAAMFSKIYEKLPENLIYIGRVENQVDLATLYSSAEVTVITSRRETFCMPVAESLSCGTPIVGFKACGPESVAISEFSDFVEYGDVTALYNAIIKWKNKLKNNENLKLDIEQKARVLYSKKRMSAEYFEIYNKLFNKDEANAIQKK